jgi:hypothetical protein
MISLSATGNVTVGTIDGTLAGMSDSSLLVAPTSNEADTLFAVRTGTPPAVAGATYNVVLLGGVLDGEGESTEVKTGVLRFAADGVATLTGHSQRSVRTATCGSCKARFAPTLQTFLHTLRYSQATDGALTLHGDEAGFTAHLSADGEALLLSRIEAGPAVAIHTVGLGFLRDP